jgi:lysylphosphatidylglycerol synthetase-like protein (DUF2156 family)
MAERNTDQDTEQHMDHYKDRGTNAPWIQAVAMVILGILMIVGTIVYQVVAWLLALVGGIFTVVVLVGIFNGSSNSDLAGAWAGAGILFAMFVVGAGLIALLMWKGKFSIWQTIPWVP